MWVCVMYVTDGMWQSYVLSLCMWKMVCELCVKFVYVKLLYVKDGLWQSYVWSYCKVVC